MGFRLDRAPNATLSAALVGNKGTPSTSNKFSTEEGLVLVEDHAGATYGPEKRIKFVNGNYITYSIADAGDYITVQVICSPPAASIPTLGYREIQFAKHYSATTASDLLTALKTTSPMSAIVFGVSTATGGSYSPCMGIACSFIYASQGYVELNYYCAYASIGWTTSLRVDSGYGLAYMYRDSWTGTYMHHSQISGLNWYVSVNMGQYSSDLDVAGMAFTYP